MRQRIEHLGLSVAGTEERGPTPLDVSVYQIVRVAVVVDLPRTGVLVGCNFAV